MPKRLTADTEPDTAFAVVLRGIDSSPLRQAPAKKAGGELPKSSGGARRKAQPSQPIPDETVEAGNRETEAVEGKEAVGGVWTARLEEGRATVSPTEKTGEEVPGQLRSLLLELLDKGVRRFRINLSTPSPDASCLAVLFSFASLPELREGEGRLEIAVQGDLAESLRLCKVEETHPITLVGE
jgi:hypothetical protein